MTGRGESTDIDPLLGAGHQNFIEVAAGICLRADGAYLLAQRPSGKVYEGYWEFPGGKLEPGESAADALKRELYEELGIQVRDCYPWLTRTYHYEHASVRLRFFRVRQWEGEFTCRELQRIAWQYPGREHVSPMLPANGPILRALRLPEVMGISQADIMGMEVFRTRLSRALEGGLRLVMLREKTWSPGQRVNYAHSLIQSCRAAGALLILNGSEEEARAAQVDGVHLTSERLMGAVQRPSLPWCGASCHNEQELQRALELDLDYVVLGSVLPTRSHPERPSMGWRHFAELLRDYPIPAFALGGMAPDLVTLAWSYGAHGIAMLRAAWLDTKGDAS